MRNAATLVALMSAIIVSAAGTASAAEPEQRFSWTGFYAGANLSYATSGKSSATIAPANAATTAFVGPTIALGSVRTNYDTGHDGVIAGAQIGYTRQWGALVLGAEADLNRANIRNSMNFVGTNVVSVPTNEFTSSIDALATFRARAGVLVAPSALLYATGGLAVAHVSQSLLVRAANGDAFAGSANTTSTGWTAGGGLEYALSRSWSMKAEYIHVRLPTQNFVTGRAGGACTSANCVLNVTTGDTSLNIVRWGLNYRF